MVKRVLVVEDNELNAMLFCDLLRAHGYDPESLHDGREVVNRARKVMPDLIVMDIHLPHVTGYELIQLMKADLRLCSIPIVAVTAYSSREHEQRIRAAGANAYIPKPISVARFIEEINALS